MEDNYNSKITDPNDHQDIEEAEEALSLSELPLHDHTDHQNQDMPIGLSPPRSPSDKTPDQLFEFFSDFKAHESNMCSAEEIIFSGKLLPNFKKNSPSSSSYYISIDEKKQIAFCRRSESSSELERRSLTRSSSTKNRTMMRNCRSLNYRKVGQTSKPMVLPCPKMDRNSSVKSVSAKSDVSVRKFAKPWWSFMMFFGIVKFPVEMELGDIKNRQVRQNMSRLFPPIDADGNILVDRSSEKGSWKLLRALSCKDHASVDVTKSFSLPQPQV